MLFALLTAFSGAAPGSTEDTHAILEQIRANVAAQISRSANYSCVETITRDYYQEEKAGAGACKAGEMETHRKTVHDRLRLNVAVSQSSMALSPN